MKLVVRFNSLSRHECKYDHGRQVVSPPESQEIVGKKASEKSKGHEETCYGLYSVDREWKRPGLSTNPLLLNIKIGHHDDCTDSYGDSERRRLRLQPGNVGEYCA